jgi:hypothetical protein
MASPECAVVPGEDARLFRCAGRAGGRAHTGLDRAPLRVTIITRRLAAISGAHKVAGVANAACDPLVREAMAGTAAPSGGPSGT